MKEKEIYNWSLAILIVVTISMLVAMSNIDPHERIVERVIDGDTFVTNKGERVRLIGVDAPESKHPNEPVQEGAIEAYEYLKDLIEGKTIKLEFDRQETDRYGRTLAYVWLQDTIFVNYELVRNCHAVPKTYKPNVRHEELFVEAHKHCE